MEGVVRCVVGYTGGRRKNPTYRSIKDHTEALLVEYDPDRVSYEDLLVSWTKMHKPSHKQAKCQYRSAAWFVNEEEQREAAEEIVSGWRNLYPNERLYTTVEPATEFYRAEEYHQNYMKKKGMNF